MNPDGSASTQRIGSFEEWQALLETYLVDKSVGIAVKKEAIAKANHKAQDHSPNEFLHLYKEERAKILRLKSSYIVAFPVWGRTSLLDGITAYEENGTCIVQGLNQGVEEKILKERSEQREEGSDLFRTIYFGCE
ncbi:hypothetical protein [Paracoccus chinensis]|uniref:hypothetical protein n=1 Tax=Paracoccus chinensis TaxID=525640 RepID=UPI0015881A63|nr:hypothetical protein [Paracoccus chinensis]